MKNKKIKKLIQGPLRFHHQDIHQEIDLIKDQLDRIESLLLAELVYKNVDNQMQELQHRINEPSYSIEELRLPESYECEGGECECR